MSYLEQWAESDGWSPAAPAPPDSPARAGPPVVARPHTWLAHKGWKTRGLLRFDDVPRPRRR
jgi:hypothetical protein